MCRRFGSEWQWRISARNTFRNRNSAWDILAIGGCKKGAAGAEAFACAFERDGASGFRQPGREGWLHQVVEENPPPGEEPILWRLLTTHKVAALEDARRIVDFYRLRWTIEQWFRTLKSQGIDLEESLIADGDALERLAAAALVAACTVMQLVNGRGEAGRRHKASRLFSKEEIKTLKVLIAKYQSKTEKQKNPHPPNTFAWAAWCIARLGGWNGYAKERPPGPISFTRGLQRFHAIAEGYQLTTHRKRS